MRDAPLGPRPTPVPPPCVPPHRAHRFGALTRPGRGAATRPGGRTLLALTALALATLGSRGTPLSRAGAAGQPPPPAPAPAAGAEDKTRDEILGAYRLAPGQDLKLMPRPRPAGLREWLDRKSPAHRGRLDEISAMTFRWRDPDHLQQWSARYGGGEGWPVRDLPRYIGMNTYEFEIEGDPELLKAEVGGDWVFREGVPAERMARSLEAALREALGTPIVLEYRDVERDAVVVRGRYRYSPVEGREKDQVEIYGKQIVEGGGGAGGGSGDFPEFLKWVGAWVERPVVNEVKVPPKGNVSWSYNSRNPSTEQTRREDHDEELVLQHLNEQTGLTFTSERAVVRVLYVGRPK